MVSADRAWANELNLFFKRFDPPPQLPPYATPTLSPGPGTLPRTHPTPITSTPNKSSTPPTPDETQICLTADQVRSQLKKTKTRKAAGPDGTSPRLLRDCAAQLCQVVLHIFNLSLRLERVPELWKTSWVVPMPKIARPRELNHYRPVALTSHLMKTLERLILHHLRPLVSPALDPLLFAYLPGLLHRSLSHLEQVGSTVRVMFFDFSTAFNTIQLTLLRGKLEGAGVDEQLTAWTIDYLTNIPQYMRLHDCVSEVVVCGTGAPQGTVLSPFLFSLYTSDFRYNLNHYHIQRCSDDTAIIGCVSDGNGKEYREVISDFVGWCETNALQINDSKTKEMIVDFRRKSPPATLVSIQGKDIETVESYKYLGVHLNDKLDRTTNTNVLYKRGQSNLHLLRRLRSLGVCRTLLRTFYDFVVASAFFYTVVCW